MERVLEGVRFLQAGRARENLERLRRQVSPAALEALPRLLPHLPDPDSALNNLERFAAKAPEAVRRYLGDHPVSLHYLLALFSYSQYLSDTLINQPELALWLHQQPALYHVKTREEMLAVLEKSVAGPASGPADLASQLARFKRREYLRIALRDVLRLATLAEVALELSALADAILEYALRRTAAEMEQKHGVPMLRRAAAAPAGEQPGEHSSLHPPASSLPQAAEACLITVLSLGKLGGNELNYSSDIDLLFIYGGAGETTGGLSNREYSIKLVQSVVGLLSGFGPEGAVFRVDLRLRPQGREGAVAVSLDGALSYYREQARDWELQALAKARHSAGDAAQARRFLEGVEPLIYTTSVNFAAIDSVLFARERITEALKRRSAQRLGVDVKLERGGIRDIEFLAQCLQRLYGGQEPWLRSAGTMFALQKLADKGYLRQRDYARLSRAYVFLRNVEHLLQLERGQQTHRLPASREALAVLARRARIEVHEARRSEAEAEGAAPGLARGPAAAADPAPPPQHHGTPGGADYAAALLAEVERHMRAVREVYDRLILAHKSPEQQEEAFTLQPETPFPVGAAETAAGYLELLRHIERNCPALYQVIRQLTQPQGPGEAQRAKPARERAMQRFLASAYANAGDFRLLCEDPRLVGRAAELFEHSPFLTELLVRHPGEIAELAELPPAGEALVLEQQSHIGAEAPYSIEDDPQLLHIADAGLALSEKMALMRRHYRKRLLHIHAHSVLGPVPVFSTLEATSLLAEQALRAAYRAAVQETARTLPKPEGEGDLIVVALGRLGIREFDIASDADLSFLYRGGNPEAKLFWTRVAERLIEIVSAYTGEGTIFAVDTRLRPRGREGELVEAERTFAQYFASSAQEWEALTYMKSRVVAGDDEEGTILLHRIQRTIGDRFGRGREAARKLAEIRHKLETVTGTQNRLKAAPGGYYDIDFILTYLRLQAAQVFFPSLTTPERLRVVESMGQLRPDQARTLREGAVFLRGLEHAVRVSTGRSDSEVPLSGPRGEAFARLARRWLPHSLAGRPLPEALDSVTRAVRGVFDEIFRV
jgi:glutamate-ammonia-ligase adenylyltransferase